MEEIRQQLGSAPVYLSFDIDAIDPGFCPGTGTPEIGGLTSIQAIEIIRSEYRERCLLTMEFTSLLCRYNPTYSKEQTKL